jgi:hypothetical protein
VCYTGRLFFQSLTHHYPDCSIQRLSLAVMIQVNIIILVLEYLKRNKGVRFCLHVESVGVQEFLFGTSKQTCTHVSFGKIVNYFVDAVDTIKSCKYIILLY